MKLLKIIQVSILQILHQKNATRSLIFAKAGQIRMTNNIKVEAKAALEEVRHYFIQNKHNIILKINSLTLKIIIQKS